jgi:hypothetical protein
MQTSVRRVAGACLVATLLAIGTNVPIASAGPAAPASRASNRSHSATVTTLTVAQAGAGWIARDLSSSGALVDAESHLPSAGDTSNAILALVAAGVGANQVKSATNWLSHNFGSYVASKGVDNPGRLALVTLAAVAAGADPLQFGGKAKSNDLVARLEATEQMTGSSAGAFGTDPNLNAFSESLALLALAAAKDLGKGTRLGKAYLASMQCSDGGWEYGRTALSTACVAPNPKVFTSPDTNTTALVAMAIVATGGHFSHSPVPFLEASQETNGSFGVFGVSGDGQQGDPDSTSYVIQALIALRAINDTQFVRNGITPEQALARFQYGCKAPVGERGEFSYFGAASQLATLQAVPAAAGVALPEGPAKLSVAEPRLSCGAA